MKGFVNKEKIKEKLGVLLFIAGIMFVTTSKDILTIIVSTMLIIMGYYEYLSSNNNY